MGYPNVGIVGHREQPVVSTLLAVSRKPKSAGRHIGALGANIEKLRLQLDLTQEQLAERSGVSRQTIIDLETGVREGARLDTMVKLGNFFHMKPSDMMVPVPDDVASAKSMLDSFSGSPFAAVLQPPPQPEELKWIESLPAIVFFTLRPSHQTIQHLILGYRARLGR